MKQLEKKQRPAEYPLYNVCYKKKNGEENVVSECVTLRKGIEALKKFDHLILSNRSVVSDILYCFLLPLIDKKPHYDEATRTFIY